MLPSEQPDHIQIAFDDHRLVAHAGLILPVTLAHHLGLGELVDRHVDLGNAPGRANAGDKMLTLVASALAGGDCIDDADALRAACWRDRAGTGLRGQGAVQAGSLPEEFPAGPRAASGARILAATRLPPCARNDKVGTHEGDTPHAYPLCGRETSELGFSRFWDYQDWNHSMAEIAQSCPIIKSDKS